jgi:hypothetical protein
VAVRKPFREHRESATALRKPMFAPFREVTAEVEQYALGTIGGSEARLPFKKKKLFDV